MPEVVKLPELGENIRAGTVVGVMVEVGATVRAGDTLLEVETDKAVIEVPSPSGGRVVEIYARAGSRIEVGQALLKLETIGGAVAAGVA
ncbi:MAG: hypothetical protein HQL57_11345, partial [Magnetococcales bacterium]|nr:hypothetical protein [Magnetococcales bacterium]